MHNYDFCKLNNIDYDPMEKYLSKDMHFRKIRNRYRITFENFMVFDDNKININTANEYGMKGILCTNGLVYTNE